MRERLIELLDACGRCDKHTEEKGCVGCEYEYFEDKCVNHLRGRMADDLLANGVIVLPCKVGDTVRFKGLESHWKVSAIHIYKEGAPQISITTESGKITSTMTFDEFAEFAFVITSEESEKALKERGYEG